MAASRGGRRVLDGVSLEIGGGATALVGPSGSGKSTLLRLLNRLADPDEGTVRFHGEDVRAIDPLELRRRASLVPQLPAPLPGSVADNVRYGPGLCGRDADVERSLRLAGLDGGFAQRDASGLSVGEQQRVMLARALALEPEVLLLDEPTSALDEDTRSGVERTLGEPHRGAARREAERVTSIHVTMGEVAAALVLVAVAAAVSLWRRVELEQDIGLAVLRSFVQLTAIGFAIEAIFDSDSLLLVAGLLAVMVGVGALTARSRARAVPRALGPLVLALSAAAASTLGVVLALGVFEPEARDLVPVGGIVIGNAMTAAAVALNRLADEVAGSRAAIEATLSLGATARQASAGLVSRSLRSGMIPLVDQTKTTGVVAFPGVMVGMLLAGADPVDAVRLQLILLWSLLGSVALSAVLAVSLAQGRFFTPAHQLRELP